mmetsp:Transcript_6698/g.18372  ORF Transcript_6698/g.18372 Transcript_6698/m.18372 type:complete len:306 (+) Transcript_6698:606-1523(+)
MPRRQPLEDVAHASQRMRREHVHHLQRVPGLAHGDLEDLEARRGPPEQRRELCWVRVGVAALQPLRRREQHLRGDLLLWLLLRHCPRQNFIRRGRACSRAELCGQRRRFGDGLRGRAFGRILLGGQRLCSSKAGLNGRLGRSARRVNGLRCGLLGHGCGRNGQRHRGCCCDGSGGRLHCRLRKRHSCTGHWSFIGGRCRHTNSGRTTSSSGGRASCRTVSRGLGAFVQEGRTLGRKGLNSLLGFRTVRRGGLCRCNSCWHRLNGLGAPPRLLGYRNDIARLDPSSPEFHVVSEGPAFVRKSELFA